MDYFDILLAKKLEGGGGGDVTIEQLDVTENGTYSEPGKAYRPVIVNLPLDEKTITANGTYNANDDNLQGYNKVIVNVAGYKLKAMTPGAIASFNDGQALPLTKLLIDIEPVQEGSGDPSPNNERPIHGWNAANITRCAKNIFNINNINSIDVDGNSTMRNGVIIKNIEGNFVISGEQTGSAYIYARIKTGDNYGSIIYLSQGTPTTILKTITLNKNDELLIYDDSAVATMESSTIRLSILQIESGTTATKYEAYNGQTFNIAFTDSGSPLTVYGGTLDIVNGVVVLTDLYGKKNGSEFDNLYVSSQTDDVVVYSITLTDASATDNFIISNRFSTNITSGNPGRMVKTGKTLYFVIAKSELTTYDSAGGVEWLANNSTDFIYKLETPQTYQLIPTPINALSGVNNIFADTGDILEGKYFAAL